jgi:hypothetical protein
MLKKSRVGRQLDTMRFAAALRTPGSDPRQWVTLAVVTAFKLDPDEGAFADVFILSTGAQETVRVGAFYSGPGFGFYAPLDVDDEVLVAFPDGDPDHGGVVVARLWSKSDAPSSTAKDNDADVSIHVKDGVNLRVAVTGGGKILLGEAGQSTKSVNREGDKVNMGQWAVVKFTAGPAIGAVQDVVFQGPGQNTSSALPTVVVVPPVPLPPPPVVPDLEGETEHGSDVVEASD